MIKKGTVKQGEIRKQPEKQNAEEWLALYGDYMYRYALFRLNNEDTSRDMVQDTLIAAWQSQKNFRGDSSVRTWLVGILKHKITDYIRKQIRDRNLVHHLEMDPLSDFFDARDQWHQPVHTCMGNPEQLSSNREFLKVLHRCIGALPEQHRHVFTLRELNGENTDTICNACDITPTNLHVIMHRARLALQKCLEKNYFEDGKAI